MSIVQAVQEECLSNVSKKQFLKSTGEETSNVLRFLVKVL